MPIYLSIYPSNQPTSRLEDVIRATKEASKAMEVIGSAVGISVFLRVKHFAEDMRLFRRHSSRNKNPSPSFESDFQLLVEMAGKAADVVLELLQYYLDKVYPSEVPVPTGNGTKTPASSTNTERCEHPTPAQIALVQFKDLFSFFKKTLELRG